MGQLACPSGTYAPANGMSFWITCPYNYACTGATKTVCAAGKYVVDGVWIICPANYYWWNGIL